MENKTDCCTDVLLSYIGMDMGYNQGKLMHIDGKEDAAEGDVGTLERPKLGLTIDPQEPDPVLFSYLYTKPDKTTALRQLLVKLNTMVSPQLPAKFSVLIPDADCCCEDEWVTRTADLTLIDQDGTNVINPHGLAQDGNYLYLVDYQNTKIFLVDAGVLETAADGAPITVKSLDVFTILDPPPKQSGRGQAVIILGDYLYALFLDSNSTATQYGTVSYLVRLTLDHTGQNPPKYDTQANVGVNGVSIIPVNDGKAVQLLVPAIGGPQSFTGGTNGIASNVSYVPAVGTWPSSAPVAVTGNPVASPATAYDIHAVAAAMRDGTSALFILTQIYTNSSATALWRIYRTTVSDFLKIGGTTLSTAVSAGDLTVVDEGTVTATNAFEIPFGIYMWDMLYEQVPDTTDDAADRVWVALGSPILVTRAGLNFFEDPAYGSPTGIFQNPFVEFGFLGGVNVNMGAFDLLIETANQAKRKVSLKRTLRRSKGTPKPTEEDIAAAKAKAAKAKAGK